MAFRPDGRQVLTSGDAPAILWDEASGRKLRTCEGHAGSLLSAVFSADGRRVLTSSKDTTVRLWDVASGDELVRLIAWTKAAIGW